MGAYIINVPSTVDRIIYVNVHPMNGKTYTASYSVENLTPYTAPDLEQIRKEAYEQGRKNGKIEGRVEVWGVARDIDHMSDDDIKACFECGFSGVFEKYTASEAIEKIKAWEDGKQKINVGDEVAFHHDDGRPDTVVVVTYIGQDGFIDGMDGRGTQYAHKNPKKWTKTGRHFPEIASILAKMREESNG